MLTEDMLAAVVDALPENCRLILVGDPNQLPPIGAGCPFVDIIEYLKREHDGAGVGELNPPRRQSGDSDQSALARSDVQLAALFSGRALPPGEDEIVVAAIEGKDDETVKYRRWERLSDFARADRQCTRRRTGGRRRHPDREAGKIARCRQGRQG